MVGQLGKTLFLSP